MNIITGMHRSGTSLAARLLHRAGADLGDPAGFYPADQWNPDGYFEQREVLALNRRLLEGSWGRLANVWAPAPATVLRRGQLHAAEIARLVEKCRGQTIKDPRFNYTGPAWEQHGARLEILVVCLRDPFEVAESLRRRNRLPLYLGLRVWRDSLQRLRDNFGMRRMWVVSYARLMAPDTCVAEAGSLIRHLGLPFDEARDADWVRELARPSTRPVSVRPYPAGVADVWEHYQALATAQRGSEATLRPSS